MTISTTFTTDNQMASKHLLHNGFTTQRAVTPHWKRPGGKWRWIHRNRKKKGRFPACGRSMQRYLLTYCGLKSETFSRSVFSAEEALISASTGKPPPGGRGRPRGEQNVRTHCCMQLPKHCLTISKYPRFCTFIDPVVESDTTDTDRWK